MVDMCAVCERVDRPLNRHGANLVCDICLADQGRQAQIAERMGPMEPRLERARLEHGYALVARAREITAAAERGPAGDGE